MISEAGFWANLFTICTAIDVCRSLALTISQKIVLIGFAQNADNRSEMAGNVEAFVKARINVSSVHYLHRS